MKINLNHPVLIKIALFAAVLFVAPFIAPLALEIILMADLMGIEALILTLIYNSRHVFIALISKLSEFKATILGVTILIVGLYIFQPEIFISHAVGSGLILVLVSSILLALTLWVPVFYFSTFNYHDKRSCHCD